MVIILLNELNENYVIRKRDIETMNKNQMEVKNAISEMKNKLEGIKSRLDKAEDLINELEDKVKKPKKTPSQSNKMKKDLKRMRTV